jgi:hypothetical protein
VGSTYKIAEILAQLDEAAKPYGDYGFPMLDHGYYYPVDQRLHAFRDTHRWALIFETLGYNPRAGDLIDVIQKFGNCVGKPGYDNYDFLGRIDNAQELDEIALSDRDWHRASGVSIRGRVIPIPAEARPDMELWDLLRMVVPEDRELFLATEEELRARVPSDLPRLLMLDEWNHPDILSGENQARAARSSSLRGHWLRATPNSMHHWHQIRTGATGRKEAPYEARCRGRALQSVNAGRGSLGTPYNPSRTLGGVMQCRFP